MLKRRFRAAIAISEVIGYLSFIALFITIGGIGIKGISDYSTNQQASAGAAAICSAVTQYHAEMHEYPDNLSDLTEENGQYGPWLLSIPDDPWNPGNSYKYLHDTKKFVVYSVGPDGADSSSLDAIGGNNIGFISH